MEQTHQINPFLRRLDNILAEPAFNDLLELSIDACLTAHGRFDKNLQDIEQRSSQSQAESEAVLLRQLGLWGVRAACEISAIPNKFMFPKPKEPIDTEDKQARYDSLLRPDTPIEFPELFSSNMDLRIAHKIEALGKSMIDEAFICLGEDAYEKVQAWQAATTLGEKARIMTWLDARVNNITTETDDGHGEDQNQADGPDQPETDEYFYHPVRLSPKLIGQFPDINLEPTCLARSILVSSFLEKAGVRYLHCGVAQSSTQGVKETFDLVLDECEEIANRWQVELPDRVAQSFQNARKKSAKALFEDNGFHAATLLEVIDGKWALMDVNYGISMGLYPETSAECTAAYEQLQQLHALAPGTERMIVENSSTVVWMPLYILRKNQHKSLDIKEIDGYLAGCDDYTSPVALGAKFIEPFFSGVSNENAEGGDSREDDLLALLRMTAEQRLYTFAEELILKQIFSDAKDNDISMCLARCKKDDEYRARRAEDLKLAPLFAAITMAGLITNSVIDHDISMAHQKLEVGLPHYRIGASVLSDFAAYCGDELPLSFWVTYWPSHVSLSEHMQDATPEHQQAFIQNHLGTSALSSLQYMKNYDIILKFLEQDSEKEPSEGGGTDESA